MRNAASYTGQKARIPSVYELTCQNDSQALSRRRVKEVDFLALNLHASWPWEQKPSVTISFGSISGVTVTMQGSSYLIATRPFHSLVASSIGFY